MRISALVVALALAPAAAGADAEAAARALLRTPLDVCGDAAAAVGLTVAPLVALAGDAVSLVDPTGLASGTLHRAALAASWTGTGALEGLRATDVERLPEARAAYLVAAPGVGRLDTFLDGVGALGLAVRDLLRGPALFALHGLGARESAAALERARSEDLAATLGPPPLAVSSGGHGGIGDGAGRARAHPRGGARALD
jgi:hypothetical protein